MRLSFFCFLLTAGAGLFSLFSSPPEQNGWGPWQSSECYSQLDYRVRNVQYNKYAEKYEWRVQFRSRYEERIHFSFDLVPLSKRAAMIQSGKTTRRTDLRPGAETDGMTWALVAEPSEIYVHINRVRFGEDGLQPYAPCGQ